MVIAPQLKNGYLAPILIRSAHDIARAIFVGAIVSIARPRSRLSFSFPLQSEVSIMSAIHQLPEATRITSRSNPRIKAMRQLHTASGRAESGTYLVEGINLFKEAVFSGTAPLSVFYTPKALEDTRVIKSIPWMRQQNVEFYAVT